MVNGRHWLLPTPHRWLVFVVALASIDALTWITFPVYPTPAGYRWAQELAPQPVWGAVFAVAAVTGLAALMLDGSTRPGLAGFAARLSMGVYGVVCGVVGISILVSTFNGSGGAMSGAAKWWLPCAITISVFSRRTMSSTTPGPVP